MLTLHAYIPVINSDNFVNFLETDEVPKPQPEIVELPIPVGTVQEGDFNFPRDEEDLTSVAKKNEKEEKRLAVMAMSKKRKRLYSQIIKIRSKKARQVKELQSKRKAYDELQRTSRKKARLS